MRTSTKRNRFILLTAIAILSLAATVPTSKLPVIKVGDPLPANAFIELNKVANPAVVNISTTVRPKRAPRGQGQPRDPFFDFFEQFYGMQGQQQNARPQTALGSGFIIREDGLIVTNNHVISGADVIQVQLTEKSDTMLNAKVIGSDERTDIALLKIEGKNYPVLPLGSSKDTEVGEWVAAFGNPFGNGHTISKGIISAKERSIGEINKYPLLQTDTPINPGNSGGPLVNLKGQVIGVNAAIVGGSQGLGFAIPIDEVKAILPQLEKDGRVRSGYLGVGLAELDPQSAEALGLNGLEGAVIAEVERGGPAANGGIKPYDVVTKLNSKRIKSSEELRDAIEDSEIGKDVKLEIVRKGKTEMHTVKVGERPDLTKKIKQVEKKITGQKAPHGLGISVADANPEIRTYFELDKNVKKPVIVDVEPDSESGFLPGDVLLDVNRQEVTKTSEAFKLIHKGVNTFRVNREGAVLFLRVSTSD